MKTHDCTNYAKVNCNCGDGRCAYIPDPIEARKIMKEQGDKIKALEKELEKYRIEENKLLKNVNKKLKKLNF